MFARTRDPAERIFEMAVAEQVSDALERNRNIERQNLATEVGNIVGQHVGAALNSLARAMR